MTTPVTTRVGFVFTRCDAILKKAQGGAATLHIGTEADDDNMLIAGNVNQRRGECHHRQERRRGIEGRHLAVDSGVRVSVPVAAATVNEAIVDVTLVGYVTDL